jgi:hypothetical protein
LDARLHLAVVGEKPHPVDTQYLPMEFVPGLAVPDGRDDAEEDDARFLGQGRRRGEKSGAEKRD